MLISGPGAVAQLPVLVVLGQLVSPPPLFRILRGIAHRMGHRYSLAKVRELRAATASSAP